MLGLAKFAATLRKMGARLGTSEVVDAALALSAVNIEEEGQVKAALAATLAKSPEERALFDQAFKAFFVPPDKKKADIQFLMERLAEEQKNIALAEGELLFQGETLDLSSESKEIYSRLDREDKDRLLEFLERASAGKRVGPAFKPLIESIVEGHLERMKSHIPDTQRHLPRSTRTGDLEVDAALMQAVLSGPSDREKLLIEDIASVSEADLAKLQIIAKDLSRRLATRFTRRYKRSARRVAIDMRKTIRANMRYGGTPFSLRYKAPRIEKPSIIVISDVSGSMVRYTGFLLQFLSGISSVAKNVEVFIFSEDLERVTGVFKEGDTFSQTVELLLSRTSQWGRGTDLGKALHTFRQTYGALCTKKTVLIVLSDGKTMARESARKHLEELYSNVRLILWLNPLKQEEWKKVPQLEDFRKYSKMFQSRSLRDLERIMRTEVLL